MSFCWSLRACRDRLIGSIASCQSRAPMHLLLGRLLSVRSLHVLQLLKVAAKLWARLELSTDTRGRSAVGRYGRQAQTARRLG
jgi:hypothetical protein